MRHADPLLRQAAHRVQEHEPRNREELAARSYVLERPPVQRGASGPAAEIGHAVPAPAPVARGDGGRIHVQALGVDGGIAVQVTAGRRDVRVILLVWRSTGARRVARHALPPGDRREGPAPVADDLVRGLPRQHEVLRRLGRRAPMRLRRGQRRRLQRRQVRPRRLRRARLHGAGAAPRRHSIAVVINRPRRRRVEDLWRASRHCARGVDGRAPSRWLQT
mmetsp:Transcript_25847/g.74478  ORF Transcript_25847/g.74478 Transcript_25847/m.74478 type:complete len:220 (+) Transcript_25847:505-1164(+)